MTDLQVVPEPSDDATLTQLRGLLGEDFTNWVLNHPTGALTSAQREVMHILLTACLQSGLVDKQVPPRLLISPLLGYNQTAGQSGVNLLRQHVGGTAVETVEPRGDPVLNSLQRLVLECFGELLLPDDIAGSSIISAYSSPAGKEATEAIRQDEQLPFGPGDDESASVTLMRSTGSGGGLQLISIASSLVGAAYERSRLLHASPTADNVIAELPTVLDAARKMYTGKPTRTLAVASITGILLPDDATIALPWGRIRPARDADHPVWVKRGLGAQRTMARAEDGSEVVISDAGDIVLEADVPLVALFTNESLDIDRPWPSLRSSEDLENRILQVRLAFALACERSTQPVLVPVWRRFIEPLAQGGGVSWNDPQRFASRTPTQLTHDEVTSWKAWIEKLDTVPMKRLGPSPTRLLRALAERTDPTDGLIDAVIAWEALFGGETEATLRVSASIARLLEPQGNSRAALRRRAADIYRLRSKIVHGADYELSEVGTAFTEATSIGLRIIRELLAVHPELVKMQSGERSTALLLN